MFNFIFDCKENKGNKMPANCQNDQNNEVEPNFFLFEIKPSVWIAILRQRTARNYVYCAFLGWIKNKIREDFTIIDVFFGLLNSFKTRP